MNSSTRGEQLKDRLGAWPTRRLAGALIAALVLISAGAIAGWYVGLRMVGQEHSRTTPPVTYLVGEETIERSLTYPVTAAWRTVLTFRSPASGIITELATSGNIQPGTVIARVNERPLVVLSGAVPAFRQLELGATGRDVAALSDYLVEAGYLDEASDTYTELLAAAVEDWQREVGIPATGTVELGDVLFVVPEAFSAPARIAPEIEVGSPLSPGMALLEGLTPEPIFTLEFGSEPPPELEIGQPGVIGFPDGETADVVLDSFVTLEGRVEGLLAPSSADSICSDRCLSLVPPDGETALSVTFTLLAPTTGPAVPVALIQTDPGGQAYVLLGSGARQDVSVVAVSGGMAIIEGIGRGDRIRVPPS